MERATKHPRDRVPEPMVMDDVEGVRAFHEAAQDVQMPIYEFNASMMSRLVPEGGRVLDLGSGSGQLAAHLAAGRPDLTVTCVDLSEPMLETGRAMADKRSLDTVEFVAGDVTSLDDAVVGRPDLVSCNWTLHQLPDRDTTVAALTQIAAIRREHGSAVWLFDFARMRRDATMRALMEVFTPGAGPQLRKDALASEAAAWTRDEMREMLTAAGLDDLHESYDRVLETYQVWWAPGERAADAPTWGQPSISRDAAKVAQLITGAQTDLPAADG
ncbi:methyltransferase domain-containing protein [Knoellia locipacati]|uniref:class I SAM-dependent methyltransferase n=1 Tax=Knoellia locipacati TaxID=882824 RepID=UPI00384FCFAB